jgi:hypothetical protein
MTGRFAFRADFQIELRHGRAASPSKTGVNALMPGHPRLTRSKEGKAWMPATSAGMTKLFERPTLWYA